MSREQYDVKQSYTGNGSLSEYSFDFKITRLSQLLVIEVDDNGVETQRVRGDDTSYLDSVAFDQYDGGGVVTLAANLASGYNLIILLADDEPVQDYEFRNKNSFSLRRFEDALDNALGAIQRLVYRTKQTIKIHDIDDEEAFNTQLPPGIADNAGRPIQVNAAGDGFEYGPVINQTPVDPIEEITVEEKTANFTAEYNKLYLVSNVVSIQLPAPTLNNKFIYIKKTGTSNITLVRYASENIDGVNADKVLSSTKQSLMLVSNGTDYFII